MTDDIAIIGSGYMGGGIAQVFALAGWPVSLADISAEAAHAARERLLAESRAFVAAGIFPANATELLDRNLSAAESVEQAVAKAGFIEEAVPEDADIKRATLARISAAAPPEAIIATNTSSIAVSALASAVREPSRFLGIHFMNPAPFVAGVEVIPHADTDMAVLAKARELIIGVGKEPANVRDTAGFVVNRLQYALFSEAARLVEEGVATPHDIDTLVRTSFGFRLAVFGPFAIADMAGLDVYAACYRTLEADIPDRYATPRLLRDLVAAGKLGTKAGAGFYDTPADQVDDLITYRNKVYVALRRVLDSFGPVPLNAGQTRPPGEGDRR